MEGLGPKFTLILILPLKPCCLKLNKMFCHNSCAAILQHLVKAAAGSVPVELHVPVTTLPNTFWALENKMDLLNENAVPFIKPQSSNHIN